MVNQKSRKFFANISSKFLTQTSRHTEWSLAALWVFGPPNLGQLEGRLVAIVSHIYRFICDISITPGNMELNIYKNFSNNRPVWKPEYVSTTVLTKGLNCLAFLGIGMKDIILLKCFELSKEASPLPQFLADIHGVIKGPIPKSQVLNMRLKSYLTGT